MPRHLKRAEFARSLEVIETDGDGQWEHVIHDENGESVHGVGRLPDVVQRIREFLGSANPAGRTVATLDGNVVLPPVDGLGLDIMLGQVAGVCYPQGTAEAPPVVWVVLGSGGCWSIEPAALARPREELAPVVKVALHESLEAAQQAWTGR